MTGTTITLSREWIESYALRVGVDVEEVEKSLGEFQEDADSYTSMANTAGKYIAILCNEDGFPRLDEYLPQSEWDGITRVTAEERAEAKNKADETARKEREAKRAVHKALREKLGMPPVSE